MQKIKAILRLLESRGKRILTKIPMPGGRGVNLWQMIRLIQHDLQDNLLMMAAASMAYTLFFSLFPTLIFFLSLVAYLPIDNLQGFVLNWLQSALPGSTYDMIKSTIDNMFLKRGAGVLSIYFIATLFLASRGVMALGQAFDRIDSFRETNPSFLKNNLKAIGLFLLLFALSVFAIAVLISGEVVLVFMVDKLTRFHISINQYYILLVANWLIQLILLLVVISILYRFAPTRKNAATFFSPGSLLAGFLLLVAQLGLRFYFTNFSNFNAVYGSLGAVMMLLTTLFWTAFALLFGFQLNIAIEKGRRLENL